MGGARPPGSKKRPLTRRCSRSGWKQTPTNRLDPYSDVAPFLWLVFAWRRAYRFYHHTIFISYALSVIMMLFVAMSGLAAPGVPTGSALISYQCTNIASYKAHTMQGVRVPYGVRHGCSFPAAIVLSLFAIILLGSGLMALARFLPRQGAASTAPAIAVSLLRHWRFEA